MATTHNVTEARGWSLSAFRQGVAAARAGKPVSVNPYLPGSDQAVIWLGGWNLGRDIYANEPAPP
jgi:ribosome modulation factor